MQEWRWQTAVGDGRWEVGDEGVAEGGIGAGQGGAWHCGARTDARKDAQFAGSPHRRDRLRRRLLYPRWVRFGRHVGLGLAAIRRGDVPNLMGMNGDKHVAISVHEELLRHLSYGCQCSGYDK